MSLGTASPTASSPSAAPAVSVILPVRDAEPYLDACLRSIARQSWRDFEVIAIDDGSRDGSAERLAAWAGRDPRFRVLSRPPRGVVAAMADGVAASRGELLARMDADDLMHSRRLELQVGALAADPRLDVVSCGVRFFPRRRVERGYRLYEAWLDGLRDHAAILRERFVESPIANPTAMLRRGVYLAAGGYRDPPWPEDYDLWLRLAESGARFGKLRRRLHLWRLHPRRVTHRQPRYGRDGFLACKAHHLARGPLRDAGPTVIWGAGPTGKRLARLLAAEGVAVEAFVDVAPRRIGGRIAGRPVVAAGALPGLLAGPRAVVLAAVAARGARALIRRRLDEIALVEGEGYWCVA